MAGRRAAMWPLVGCLLALAASDCAAAQGGLPVSVAIGQLSRRHLLQTGDQGGNSTSNSTTGLAANSTANSTANPAPNGTVNPTASLNSTGADDNVVPAGSSLLSGTKGKNKKLWKAAAAGNVDLAKDLISKGADVNVALGSLGSAPLHLAAQNAHLDMLLLLIEAGADIEVVRSDDGATPLYVAATFGNLEVVEALLDAGAAVDSPDAFGQTPLSVAAQVGSVEIVQVLLEAGADPNAGNADGDTALHFSTFTIGNHSVDIANALLDAGADINALGLEDETPLMLAAYYGNAGSVEVLLARGASKDIEDAHGHKAEELVCGCTEDEGKEGVVQCPEGGCEVDEIRAEIEAALV
eukprot:evm.model.scf_1005.1 EVM.evm.TU.scf_1005.1   scf_1005:42743-47767(+)